MNTKWNFLMVLALLAMLVGGSSRPAQAQGGVLDVFPREGTVGTVINLTGSGFGWKQGEVLLGAEKCKVLSWSNTEIMCEVFKPQHAGEYVITVLPQGDKKPAAPMTFSYFIMRRPHITLGEVVRDGDTVTIEGKFFGDKKGEVRLVYRDNGEEIKGLKVVYWGMHSIRFELPGELTGSFALVVLNEVGKTFVLLDLQAGLGLVGQNPDAPGWGDEEADATASGIFYKGKFYTFTVEEEYLWQDDNFDINMRVFDPVIEGFSAQDSTFPGGKTSASPVPLVIDDTLWLFYPGVPGKATETWGNIFYVKYKYDGNTGTGSWLGSEKKILDLRTNSECEVAPVYDPINHRIIVYFQNYDTIHWVTSDDGGASWVDRGLLPGSGAGFSMKTYGLGGIYYHDPAWGPTALVSFIDSKGVGNVVMLSTVNGTLITQSGANGYIMNNGSGWVGRPFLVDLSLGSGAAKFAVVVARQDGMAPMIIKFDGIWHSPYQAVYLPEVDGGLAQYYFRLFPNAAINYVPNSSGEPHLYLFYMDDFYASYGDYLYYHWMMYDTGSIP